MTDRGFLDVPTADGRTLEVLTGGDPGGFPWVFFNGSPTGAAPSAFLDEAARTLGLRLVTWSRPGYGASTPRPAPGAMADDVPDTVTVLDFLGLGEFVTAGWSGGGPRALGCAALLPDRCRAAATVAGVAPADGTGLDWSTGMAPENVEEYAAAAAGPQAYERFIERSLLPMLAATPEQLRESMAGLFTPIDTAALTPALADWLSRTFHAAGAQGVVGARDDGIAAVRPWGFELAGIRVPVAVWQGAQDAMVPFAHGAWLAAHVPGAEAHLFEHEGHLSLFTRFDEVLADLIRLGGVG